MLWLFVGPTGVYLLDFFCSGIQFNLLLSPYPCFISLLYLDLYEPRSDRRDLLAIKVESEIFTDKVRPSCCEQLQKI